MSFDKLLVKTTGGSSIIDSDNDMYVSLAGDEYLKKKARDINIGDRILFLKESVATSLNDVEPFFERSPRYVYAKEALHEKNSAGVYVSKLRTLLIRGLSNTLENLATDSDLEKRVLFEVAPDFGIASYSDMLKEVIETINRCQMTPLKAGTINWLKGAVLCPRDWNYFRALEKINPAFKDFDMNDRSIAGKHFQAKLYYTVRQGVMRYLSKCKGLGEGPKNEEDVLDNTEASPYGIELTPELQPVLEFFVKDVDKDYTFVRVTDISSVRKRAHLNEIEKEAKNLKLSKGVVTNKMPTQLPLTEVDLSTLMSDRSALLSCYALLALEAKETMSDLTRKLLHDQKFQTSKAIKTEGYFACCIGFAVGKELMRRLDSDGTASALKKNYDEIRRIDELYVGGKVAYIADQAADFVMKKLSAGELDREYGLDEGTMLNIALSLNLIEKSLPYTVHRIEEVKHEYEYLNEQIYNAHDSSSLELYKQLTKENNRLLKFIRQNYNAVLSNNKLLLGDLLTEICIEKRKEGLDIDYINIGGLKEYLNLDWFRKSLQQYIDNHKIFTKVETQKILQKYGVSSFMKVLSSLDNFILEQSS